jgi:hypothetical protein
VTTVEATATSERATGAKVVLLTLAAGPFPMTLDTSAMNVSIATVAKDVGTAQRIPTAQPGHAEG